MQKTLTNIILGIATAVLVAGGAMAQGFEMPEMLVPDGIVQLETAEQDYLAARRILEETHGNLAVAHANNKSATAAVVTAIADDAGDNEALMTTARSARADRGAKQQSYDDALAQYTAKKSALDAVRAAQADASISETIAALTARIDDMETPEPVSVETSTDISADVAAMKALLETLCGRLKEGIYAANCATLTSEMFDITVTTTGSFEPVGQMGFTISE